jgi:hypothetical protein
MRAVGVSVVVKGLQPRTLHQIIKVFFSPTDAQLDSLKNKFKFALKFTLKGFKFKIVFKTIQLCISW